MTSWLLAQASSFTVMVILPMTVVSFCPFQSHRLKF